MMWLQVTIQWPVLWPVEYQSTVWTHSPIQLVLYMHANNGKTKKYPKWPKCLILVLINKKKQTFKYAINYSFLSLYSKLHFFLICLCVCTRARTRACVTWLTLLQQRSQHCVQMRLELVISRLCTHTDGLQRLAQSICTQQHLKSRAASFTVQS